jgi:hypothetical protein
MVIRPDECVIHSLPTRYIYCIYIEEKNRVTGKHMILGGEGDLDRKVSQPRD